MSSDKLYKILSLSLDIGTKYRCGEYKCKYKCKKEIDRLLDDIHDIPDDILDEYGDNKYNISTKYYILYRSLMNLFGHFNTLERREYAPNMLLKVNYFDADIFRYIIRFGWKYEYVIMNIVNYYKFMDNLRPNEKIMVLVDVIKYFPGLFYRKILLNYVLENLEDIYKYDPIKKIAKYGFTRDSRTISLRAIDYIFDYFPGYKENYNFAKYIYYAHKSNFNRTVNKYIEFISDDDLIQSIIYIYNKHNDNINIYGFKTICCYIKDIDKLRNKFKPSSYTNISQYDIQQRTYWKIIYGAWK